MTDDIKGRLDAELPDHPVPFALTADGAVTVGRRARRRRRLLAGGSGLLSIAVAAVLVTAGVNGGLMADPAPVTEESPVVELPDLDPYGEYTWSIGWEPWTGPVVNPGTEAYTDAFWRHFQAEYPQAELDPTEYYTEGQPQGTVKEPLGFRVVTYELEQAGSGTVHSHAAYGLLLVMGDDSSSQTGPMQFQFGDGMPNFLDVTVHPAGSYRQDAGDLLDLAYCWPGDDFYRNECVTTETTGPAGERVQQIDLTSFRVESGEISTRAREVVLYREDGTAVEVSTQISGTSPGQNDQHVTSEQTPALGHDDLTGIALALPDDPVVP
jgi:hypothetical protein